MSRTSSPSTGPFDQFQQALRTKRCIVIVGLPATGKSALVRESARIAGAGGRRLHLLQWDVARVAWDRPDILARFPEVDGVTHSGIRGAIGLWVRAAVGAWFQEYAGGPDLLLIEAPIVGGRFAKLAKKLDDPLEPQLAGEDALFVILAPALALHADLRRRRAREANIEAGLERHNASLGVVDVQVAAVEAAAKRLGWSPKMPGKYDPDLFVDVMRTVLSRRRVLVLRPDSLIGAEGSVYDYETGVSRIEASPVEVAETIQAVERDLDGIRTTVEIGWSLV